MFDIGWSEMLVIAIVLIVVVGPKDLPRMLRTFGKTTAKLRGMAGDFQRQFNEALKEAELDDVKKSVDELRGLNPASEIRKQLNPFEKAASDIRSGLDNALKSSPAPQPASEVAQPAEPVKAGAAAMPGVAGPDAMPAAPAFPAASSEPAGTAAKPKKKAAARSESTKAASKVVDASAPAKAGVKTKPAAAKTAASASKAPAKAAADKPAKPQAAAATAKAKKAAAEKTSAGNAK